MSGKGDADTRSPDRKAREEAHKRISWSKKPLVWHNARKRQPSSQDTPVWVRFANGAVSRGKASAFNFNGEPGDARRKPTEWADA